MRLGLQSPSTQDVDRCGRAQPAVGDPGSKGRRVAWKTSSGLGADETEDATMARQAALACCVDLPVTRGMDGEARFCRAALPQPSPAAREEEAKGSEKSKLLCGFDERHWFVAAIPESGAGSRRRRVREGCASAGGRP